MLAVRANARLILSRMESHVGPGAADAARRRQQTMLLERQEAKERQAQAISLRQGRNLLTYLTYNTIPHYNIPMGWEHHFWGPCDKGFPKI